MTYCTERDLQSYNRPGSHSLRHPITPITPLNEAFSRVQAQVLPPSLRSCELELVSCDRLGDSFAKKFFDICCHNRNETWLFLGDVSGHGPSAALVKLMAQRIFPSLAKTLPGIGPSKLNFLANKALCAQLRYFDVQRHLSVVSICQRGDGRFVVSGSHKSMFVLRAGTGEIENVAEVPQFSAGLGMLGHLEMDDFSEYEIELSPQDILYIGTDGATRAAQVGYHGTGIFGEDSPMRSLSFVSRPSWDKARADLAEYMDEANGDSYGDDVAIVMIRPLAA